MNKKQYLPVSQIKKYSFFWLGLTAGVIFSSLSFSNYNVSCNNKVPKQTYYLPASNFTDEFEPHFKTPKKPTLTNEPQKKIIRPRYYSTELGIKEKLFIGVLTSFDTIGTFGAALNSTLTQVADKIKYFVQVPRLTKAHTSVIGSDIVAFTEIRSEHMPFHAFKYIGDNFVSNFDYFFIVPDTAYVNAFALRSLVENISVSANVYTGVRRNRSSYCLLEAGIILSASVIRSMVTNLEWCVRVSGPMPGDNIGACVAHAHSGLECTSNDESYTSFLLGHYNLQRYLQTELIALPEFNRAVTIRPLMKAEDVYILHTYFSKRMLTEIQSQVHNLRSSIEQTLQMHPTEFRKLEWPVGEREHTKPKNRHDVMSYVTIDNSTNDNELADLKNVLDEGVQKVLFNNDNKLKFHRLINAYRLYDAGRGLDYILDLVFEDMTTGKEVRKRLHACKSLGHVELVPVPYVTENSRVVILLPITRYQNGPATEFIRSYMSDIATRKEKTLLMLVFLYEANMPSQGSEDLFSSLKSKVLKTDKDAISKIAWVSIRLPAGVEPNSVDGVLKFAVIDLALRKIGLDVLIFFTNVYAMIRYDFLNRVRMNTIMGFQVFSPVPFEQYDPRISKKDEVIVNKQCGHFNSQSRYHISFYGKDYVKTRKSTEKEVPIVRSDKDITILLNSRTNCTVDLFEYFIKHNKDVHGFRAVEPSLKIKYHTVNDTLEPGYKIASKEQLAKLIYETCDSHS